MHNTLKTDIENLIKIYENKIKNYTTDQFTDDAMDSKEFDGIQLSYEQVINDLKQLLKS